MKNGSGVTTAGSRRAAVRAWMAVMALVAAFMGTAPPVAADDDGGGMAPAVPGEFVVEVAPGADPAAINSAVGGVAVPQQLDATSRLYRFRLPPTTDPAVAVDLIAAESGVVRAEANLRVELADFFGTRRVFWSDHEPPAPAPASSYSVHQPALARAGLPATGGTGSGVIVAVLDTGVDLGHPAFAGRVAPGGYDFVEHDSDPAEVADGIDNNGNGETDEAFGHGTHVAGIVALVAPDARILPIRILDSDGTTDAWRILQGLDHAAALGARVANLSLGGVRLGEIAEERINGHVEEGMVVVAAAGNEATDQLRYPAAISGVVGVTAIDGATGRAATFANRGSWIAVAAPGVRVVSTFPEGGYAIWGGTSASAPVVAGALAVVAGVMGPSADTDDIADRLTSTAIADDLANLSAYGRIDVAASVERAAIP